MVTKEKPECPESHRSWYNEIRLCNLDRKKICLLESGDQCNIYNKWLEELEKEEQNGSG